MNDRDLAAVHTQIGMVFPHFNLWPHMTALGNVIESPSMFPPAGGGDGGGGASFGKGWSRR
jgi:hypothetical protein